MLIILKYKKTKTFVDEGVFTDDRYNTNPNDKTAETPDPNTGAGTIKLQPAKMDYFPDKDDANEGNVTIKGNKDALKITTDGEYENTPSVDYGSGKPHK